MQDFDHKKFLGCLSPYRRGGRAHPLQHSTRPSPCFPTPRQYCRRSAATDSGRQTVGVWGLHVGMLTMWIITPLNAAASAPSKHGLTWAMQRTDSRPTAWKKQQPNILYTTPVLRRRRHGLHYAYSVNQKLYSPYGFLAIFPQRLRILK